MTAHRQKGRTGLSRQGTKDLRALEGCGCVYHVDLRDTENIGLHQLPQADLALLSLAGFLYKYPWAVHWILALGCVILHLIRNIMKSLLFFYYRTNQGLKSSKVTFSSQLAQLRIKSDRVRFKPLASDFCSINKSRKAYHFLFWRLWRLNPGPSHWATYLALLSISHQSVTRQGLNLQYSSIRLPEYRDCKPVPPLLAITCFVKGTS